MSIEQDQTPTSGAGAIGDAAPRLAAARSADLLGHRIHLGLAVAHLVSLPLATAPAGATFVILAIWTVVRLPHTWRSYAGLWRVPAVMATAAWITIFAASIAWSRDPAQGFDELRAARAVLLPLMLWPIIAHAPLLIAAACVGVAGQNAAQLLQLVGVISRDSHADGGRVGGLIHPIQTATWCLAALTWHISAMLQRRGRVMWLSLLGAAAAAAGLLATGSRGPWIAAAITLPIALLLVARQPACDRRRVVVLALLGVVAAGAAWPLARPRVAVVLDEIEGAVERDEHWTSVGRRIGLWSWALTVFGDHPLLGVGAGGYRIAVEELPEYRRSHARAVASLVEAVPGYDTLEATGASPQTLPGYERAAAAGAERAESVLKDHAHSILLHTLACEGLLGAAAGTLVLGLVLVQTVRDPRDHLYAAVSPAILVGWVIGAQFDCHHLNGHLFGLAALIAAVTLPGRPAPDDPRFHDPPPDSALADDDVAR